MMRALRYRLCVLIIIAASTALPQIARGDNRAATTKSPPNGQAKKLILPPLCLFATL
jgi:hypothetical protein